jgi:hypothetical protein
MLILKNALQVHSWLQQHDLLACASLSHVPRQQPIDRDTWAIWSSVWPLTWRQPSLQQLGHSGELLDADAMVPAIMWGCAPLL